MPRKKRKLKRPDVKPDPKYNSMMVQKLINQVMNDGKKATAMKIVYDAMDYLAEQSGAPALEALETALNNIKPPLEVRSRRVGGATYQVPVEVRPARQNALCVRWLVMIARARKDKSMAMRLGRELTDAFNNTGTAVKKRSDTIKMAQANQAFAHYRW